MKSEIVKKAESLYESGQVPEALQYYVVSLWRREEENTELLSAWLGDPKLLSKAGEQAVCGFIAAALLVIDAGASLVAVPAYFRQYRLL